MIPTSTQHFYPPLRWVTVVYPSGAERTMFNVERLINYEDDQMMLSNDVCNLTIKPGYVMMESSYAKTDPVPQSGSTGQQAVAPVLCD